MKAFPTIELALRTATEQLTESGSESPSLDAAILLCQALNKPRSYLLTWPERTLSEAEWQDFSAFVSRRQQGEPVAYITGEREFWSLPLKVSPFTLIPRPDTERLVELALEKAQSLRGPVLDLGTGTGAIALALASELPEREIYGVDIRPEARQLASDNARRLGIHNARFFAGSWFSPLPDEMSFSVIVSNPPYIDENDPHLAEGDVRFEPRSALVAADNGLADIRYISQQAVPFLESDGWLLFEHGYQQGPAVREILQKLGYRQVSTEQDYAGLDRVTMGLCPDN